MEIPFSIWQHDRGVALMEEPMEQPGCTLGVAPKASYMPGALLPGVGLAMPTVGAAYRVEMQATVQCSLVRQLAVLDMEH